MVENTSSKPAWRRADNLLILVGVGLLAAFFVAKGWSRSQSLSGIDAFEDALAANETFTELAEAPEAVQAELTTGQDPLQWHDDATDTSLWSEKRVREYEEALRLTQDAPQALLNIDHLDIRVPVYNGADDFNLNRGVARILGTARVGEGGNLGIAGHRDGFFRPLKDIKVGDAMTLETFQGPREYRVSSVTIVDPTDLSVLGPVDADVITLVTCYPFYYVGNAPQRYIVRAEALVDIENS